MVGYQVVLDACVLVNAALRDTLLRIAEPPRLYLPRWLNDIMPNMLLVAPSFNGKTSILERFLAKHPPELDPERQVTVCPVVRVESPDNPDVMGFYTRILDALMAPYKPSASINEKYSQIKVLFRQLRVKMLLVDEIHHLIAGGLNRQRNFRNALKSLGNETKVVIVAAGTEDAYNAFNTDPQMSSRFTPEELPLWRADNAFGSLLDTLELRTPLRKPSNLKDPGKMQAIHTRSEGTLGDLCDFFKELAVDAIRSKAEEITLERIQELRWVPQSIHPGSKSAVKEIIQHLRSKRTAARNQPTRLVR